MSRTQRATNPHHVITQYGIRTSTGTYRKHLVTYHLEEWVAACKKRNVVIKTDVAKSAAEGLQPDSADANPRKPYSNEAFVDALVEFIVGDDLVRPFALFSSSPDVLITL
jgi:hypothetical protein